MRSGYLCTVPAHVNSPAAPLWNRSFTLHSARGAVCAVADLRRVAGLGPGEGAAPQVLNLVAYTQAGSFARFIFLVAPSSLAITR